MAKIICSYAGHEIYVEDTLVQKVMEKYREEKKGETSEVGTELKKNESFFWKITCPKCRHEFRLAEVLAHQK